MINNTIEQLRAMKMNAMASELERQLEDPESYNQVGFEDRLAMLVDTEWNRRQNNKYTRYIRNAHFSDANATIEGIEYIEKTGTNVDEIKLAVSSLIAEGVEVIFTPTDNTVMTAELSIYEAIADAGILHYTGADSFALNGAFLGYGVDYANLGRETADMIYEVLYKNADISTLSVKTFDNGTATINEDIIAKLGLDLETLKTAFGPYCTKIATIETGEEFQ